MNDEGLRPAFALENIRVIESLPAGEAQTGSDLYRDVLNPACLDQQQFWSAGLMRVRNAYSLMVGLHQLVAEAQERRFNGLIVDIEAHGGANGIQLASGDGVAWRDLRPPLTALNLACRNNLFIVMASCDGSRLVKSIDVWQRAPFCGWIGPHGTVSSNVLRGITHAFFRALIRTKNVTEALREATAAAALEVTVGGRNADALVCLMAHDVFDHVMEQTRRQLPTGEALDRKVAEMVARAEREKALLFEQLGRDDFTKLVRAVFTDPRLLHQRLRRNFLMMDLYPDPAGRFDAGGEGAAAG